MVLIKNGIYSTIAVALKGGAWREVSMMMVADAIATARLAVCVAREPILFRCRTHGVATEAIAGAIHVGLTPIDGVADTIAAVAIDAAI